VHYPLRLPRARLVSAFACLSLSIASSEALAEPDRWWATDKALHFSACFMLAGDGYATASVLSEREPYRLLTGFGLAFVAGAAKEAYDKSNGGDASWRDLTWDVVGAATGAAISWIIDRYVF
jgi:putative lipoprotein